MKSIDVIVTWPIHCDYPLWRQYIRDNRSRFNEVIIVFTQTNRKEDYREFIREAMFEDHVVCIDPPAVRPEEDWRNNAVHAGLLHSSNSEWILFTEQDFYTHDSFWDDVQRFESWDAICIKQGERIHPCFLLMRRTALNRTRKQFGIVKDKLDHFGLIQEDIHTGENHITCVSMNILNLTDVAFIHMNGLSHNMTLLMDGQTPNFEIERFRVYLKKCLEVQVPIHPDFIACVNHSGILSTEDVQTSPPPLPQ